MKIIRIIGGESTGKTSLAGTLANKLEAVLVPEMARSYLVHRVDYQQKELEQIAELQCEEELKAIKQSPRFVICDTDLHVLQVWSEYKYNTCPYWILDYLGNQPADLYIVCGADIPWQFDPLRENPHPQDRRMFERWYSFLAQCTGKPFYVLYGSELERVQMVLSVLKHL